MKRSILFFVFLIVTTTSVLADSSSAPADALAAAGDVQYDIRVDGITCPFCVATSERALKKIEGVHAVGSNLETGKIFVCADSRVEFTDAQLQRLFLDKGFTYRSFEQAPGCSLVDREHDVDAMRDIPEDHANHPARKS